jgi:hypothetical protein
MTLGLRSSPIPPPFSADWFDIVEWADAVAKVGPLLSDTIAYAKTVRGDPTGVRLAW